MIKTLLPLTVFLYLSQALVIAIGCIEAEWLTYCFLAAVALSFVLGLANIIFAVADRKTAFKTALGKSMVFKLVLIPYYILNFAEFIILLAGGAVTAFAPLFWPALLPILLTAFLICCFSYFIMISTSALNIVALIRERRGVNPVFALVNVVLQFVPVADVLDTVYLYNYLKNKTVP